MIWNDDRTITVDPPRKPKKITGTRLGAILGLNRWCSPFEVWCAITRTYEEPFVENRYTRAGKAIEPKQADYIREQFWWGTVTSPSDIWGEDYFRKTWGDFYKETPIFGGMWDYLLTNSAGEVEAILEMKTTKRAEDWTHDIPEYYAIQAALYAHLLNVDQVYMVCTVLEEGDYEHPEDFIPTEGNTFIRAFKLSERYPNMGQIINNARAWWEVHVETGISPQYSETRDADILKALRSKSVTPDTDLLALVREAEDLQDCVTRAHMKIQGTEKRLKELKELIRQSAVSRFPPESNRVIVPGERYDFVTTRTSVSRWDEEAMERDGVRDKYRVNDTGYRMTIQERT